MIILFAGLRKNNRMKKSTQNKKIVIFSGFYLPSLGGVERYTNKLATELKRMGYDVIIVTANHADLKSIEYENFRIYRLPTYKLFRSRYPIIRKNKECRELLQRIKDENADHFICNTRFHLTTPVGARLARASGKGAVLIEHGSSHFTVGNPVLDKFGLVYEHALTKSLKKNIQAYYGVSLRCNEWLRHFNIRAKGVFYNSVDSTAYEKYKTKGYKKKFGNKTVITYAGRIMREKGVILLLDAFTELSRSRDDIVLVIAGEGDIASDLKRKYSHPSIHFEGKLDYDGVMSLFNSTDIFCHPSMYPEGLPTVILEAGLMKCAVIATDRGGTKEVIKDKDYGIIINENQQSLASALERLLDKPEVITRMKQRLHERVTKEFSWRSTALHVSKELEALEK